MRYRISLFSFRVAVLAALSSLAGCSSDSEQAAITSTRDGGRDETGETPPDDDGVNPSGVCSPQTADCNGDPSDGCETKTSSSETNCGGCGVTCGKAPAHGNIACKNGTCTRSCASGYELQGTTCVPGAPPPLACGGDAVDCGGVCRAIASDPLNCGSCGKTCDVPQGGSARCDQAKCRPECPVGTALSGTTCNAVPVGSITPTLVPGSGHTCGLTSQGTVRCWGSNDHGQIGTGTSSPTKVPTPTNVVDLGGGATHVALSAWFSCAVTNVGGVKCWGNNAQGQLGAPTNISISTKPVDVTNLSGPVKQIAMGVSHACALLVSGEVQCWGDNQYGQLGDGSTTNRPRAVPVSGLSGVLEVTAGGSATCARLGAGAVKCWGGNGLGQVGDGSGVAKVLVPSGVVGLGSNVVAIRAGVAHVCALLGNGSVRCWGWNGTGQLGDGSETDRPTPVAVQGLSGSVDEISTRGDVSCARKGGTVSCWGDNYWKTLTSDATIIHVTAPLSIPSVSGATKIMVGDQYICAAMASGFVCWGRNADGQLGNGTFTDAPTPIPVTF
ncbi:BNR repeat domain protein [Labilithrix luteola]|uniref:BNR repeat domain protein n=1 Tax=Labilithrix luteola TaxID=1391654 RepID=A0A0K1Q6K1_9BACT|nr:hypothetical protein [Labilithrix luteola]AKV01363.1 BNR repeat domain protein [Labilithrix luteola]